MVQSIIGQSQINKAMDREVGQKNENACNKFKQEEYGLKEIKGTKEQVMNESVQLVTDIVRFHNTSVFVRSDIINLLANSAEGNTDIRIWNCEVHNLK